MRVRHIRLDSFEVAHVIHRHGMTENQAFEVEAALIDAYPETTNQIGGRASDERGLMHANQIVERYEAPEADFKHKAILITVNRTAGQRESVYAAVRYAWKIDPSRAENRVIFAVRQGLIIGAFIAEKWLPATTENFPALSADEPDRWGFIGHEASPDIAALYLRRRVPDSLQKRGAANPIRYVG